MKLMTVVLLMGLFVTTALATDVSGTWAGEKRTGEGGVFQLTINLKADGNKVTGAVVSRAGEIKIEDGTINGDQVSFSTKIVREGVEKKQNYTCKIDGDKMKVHQQFEGAEKGADWDLTKK
jgi:hypothetical protein